VHGVPAGQIVILNGTPRSGKSSIAAVIQNTFEGVWMNLGMDRLMQMTPDRYQPGIGLRPGGERPDLEPPFWSCTAPCTRPSPRTAAWG
jgi:chloramphenicol 3-O phosphotransferase